MSLPHYQTQGRKAFKCPNLERFEPYNAHTGDRNIQPETFQVSIMEANLISSELESGLHKPVFDVDFPIRAVPSTTPGHFHLYLDGIEMEWPKYEALLRALAEAGVIEQGYYEASVSRGASYVRTPWQVKKSWKTDRHGNVEFTASRAWAIFQVLCFIFMGNRPQWQYPVAKAAQAVEQSYF